MHGRLKVKTTAEQEEEKRKEKQKKLSAFRDAMTKAINKRKSKEFNKDAIEINHQLLLANPDLAMIWNFQKEILLHMKEEKVEDVKSVFKDELSFTESCLRVNPKSYGAWFHRCWILDTMPEPDWEHEINLCDRYLELDERNFHCWDYRRFVVSRAKVPAEEELKFTTKLINKNFSNYSAWHYRSKLLPLIYPDPQSQLLIGEEARLQELDLVQNAAFTDPNDQSAWFYHRWLLGRGEEPFKPLCLYVNRLHSVIIVSLKKSIMLNSNAYTLTATFDDKNLDQNWKASKPKEIASNVWILNIPEHLFQDGLAHKIQVITTAYDDPTSHLMLVMEENQKEGWIFSVPDYSMRFKMDLSAAATSLLEKELSSSQQLEELEPDSKWTVLTGMLLMRAINPEKYETQTLTQLEKLSRLDVNRVNYYKDLYSKFVMENVLRQLDLNQRRLSLAKRKLTALYHLNHLLLIVELDLSHNYIKSLKSLHSTPSLRSLIADDNLIDSCSGLEFLLYIEQVSLSHNKIANEDEFLPLKSCLKLSGLNITGNPICETNISLKPWLESHLHQIQHLYL